MSEPKSLVDWSSLPRDMYVVEARKIDNIVYEAKLCSVPMALAPEVRYVRADLIDALVEALEQAHHACVTLDNYGAMNRVMLITTEALARTKGEPK